MRERYQGGSLAGFIIIGVVLTLVFVGGLYGLSRYNAEQSKEVATDDKAKSDDQANKDKESSSESKPQTDKPSEQSPSDTKDESKDEATGDKASDNTSNDQAPANKQLPTTGPVDVATMVLGATALSFAAVHYLQSRTQRSR